MIRILTGLFILLASLSVVHAASTVSATVDRNGNLLPASRNGNALNLPAGTKLNGGTLSNSGGGLPVVNVSDYGAVGNGTTDDTTAWQAAINAAPNGATIVASPTANYKITSSLNITSRQSLTLFSPSTATVGFPRFTWAGANGGVMLKIYDSYACRVDGFSFNTTNGTTINKCIDIDRVSGFSSAHMITNCVLNGSNQDNASFIALSIDASGGVNNENMHIDNVLIFGSSQYAQAVADDGAMTSGAAVLTSATANFNSSGLVGKTVRVGKAGAAGATLLTTVVSRDSATQLTLAANASATVTAARIHIGNPSGIGIQNGNNPNAKHQVIRNCQIQYCDIGIKSLNGSVEIFNLGGGYSNIGFQNINGNTEPIIIEQMVTEGNLIEVDEQIANGNLELRNCRGANTYQLTEGFYRLDGRVAMVSCDVEVAPPTGGRIFKSYASGNLELMLYETKLAKSVGNISVSAAGFDSLSGSDVMTTMGNVNVTGWSRTFYTNHVGMPSSQPLTIAQRWNSGPDTFTGILENITDAASASGSLLMDLQVGGTSKASVSKTGVVKGTGTMTPAVAFASAIAAPAEGTLQAFTDASTNTWGATIAGGGANHVLGYYNGTNWTVIGK